ncbi:MAG: DUF1826 domain-containing protein [Tateyamaria sp.]|jgi:hypothetical protein|uniref:DUF1826 domain-containing protein n=1 Tax=Tateyamaria sp. TaxID=1929288 RepID=UPI0032DDFE20
MTLHQSLVREQSVGVCVTSTPKGLSSIKDPRCSAAIWKREPAAKFQNWIDSLYPVDLPRARIMLRAEMVRDAMTDLVDAHALSDCDEREMLIDDIAALAAMFSSIMESRYLRLRLDVIETNAYRDFHIDAVTARLICSYRGRATQYGNGAMGHEPKDIHDVPTGSPIILRGTSWRSTAEPGLLHRSPPLEGTGETRLVLVLDPIADIEADESDGHVH